MHINSLARFPICGQFHRLATPCDAQARRNRRRHVESARQRVWRRRQLDSRSACGQSPLAVGNVDRARRHRRSPSPASVSPPPAPTASGGSVDAIRPAPRRAPPSAPRRRWQPRAPAPRQREHRPGTPCPAETLSRPTYLQGSLGTAGAHRLKLALPTDSSKRASLVDGHGFGRQCSQGVVDGLTLGSESITPHHFSTRPIVYVYVGACHTPTIHHEAEERQDMGWNLHTSPFSHISPIPLIGVR